MFFVILRFRRDVYTISTSCSHVVLYVRTQRLTPANVQQGDTPLEVVVATRWEIPPRSNGGYTTEQQKYTATATVQYVIVRWRHCLSAGRTLRRRRRPGGGERRARRVCESVWMNPRRLGPVLPIIQQVAIGQPVAGWKTHGHAGGGPGGPPLRSLPCFCCCCCRRCCCRRPVHRRDLNVHRSQVAISVDRFWSTVEPRWWSSAYPYPYPSAYTRSYIIIFYFTIPSIYKFYFAI